VSVIAVCFPNDLSMTPYRSRPHERPGSSGHTSLVAATSQSVRFARSLATRFQAVQLHLHTCVCPLKWVGGKRACTLVAGTQDIALVSAYVSHVTCSCYVSCRIQAPPHLRLHKRTVFHAAYVTCPWNWRLCGTNHPILDIANGSPVFSGIWRWPSQHRNISFQ